MICRMEPRARATEAQRHLDANVLVRTSFLRKRGEGEDEWRGRVVTVCGLYPARGDVLVLQLAGTRRTCRAIPLSVILDIEPWNPDEA